MKRRALEKQLRHAGCHVKREGSNHSLWTKQDGADIKAELIKWMFLFWIAQIAVLIVAAKILFGGWPNWPLAPDSAPLRKPPAR